MTRTTVVSAEAAAASDERGSLKLFFSYAPCSGTTAALLDEVRDMTRRGEDVFIARLEACDAHEALGTPFDLDQALKRHPDLVALDDFAAENPEGSRNRYRYQDAQELLHAGIDVYAVLRVSNLESERDRVAAITGEQPRACIPDRLFYEAQQLEFVDIDPQELIERARSLGRPVADISILRQLRAVALQCVTRYAAQSDPVGARTAAGAVLTARDRVVALVSLDESPAPVLHETSRLAAASRATLQVVCVLPESAERLSTDAEKLARRLSEQVEALGYELTVLYGTDQTETLRDYLRVQGATDLVMTRRPLAAGDVWQQMRLRWVQGVEAMDGVRVHVVPGYRPVGGTVRALRSGSMSSLLDFRPLDLALALAITALGVLLAIGSTRLGLGEVARYLSFVLSTAIVASVTRAYVPSAIAVLLSCLAADLIMRPVLAFATGRSSTLNLVLLFIVLSVVAALCVGLGRSAASARRRERHTQALFELSRDLHFAHGTVEVVDASLDALVRLFDRSVAFYVRDPFSVRASDEAAQRRCRTVQVVAGDFGADVFDKVTERNVAHWVFLNGERAGYGTNTNETSDMLYLPLMQDDSVLGVIAVSCRRPLDTGEEEFLEAVCGQVLGALELQEMSAGHLRDQRNLEVGTMRDAFRSQFAISNGRSASTIAELARILQATRDDDAAYRDCLEQVLGMEALRSRIMVTRVNSDAAAVSAAPTCEMRSVIAKAVDFCQQGRGSTVINMEPGDEVTEVCADALLLRLASIMVIESSLLFAPVGGVIDVTVSEHAGRVSVSVADDRPDALASRSPALRVDFDQARASHVVETVGDRSSLLASSDWVADLARAVEVPLSSCMVDGHADMRRLVRADRTQYGLYVASQVIRAHGGEVKQRRRLGGGAVTTFSLPVAR